VYWDKERVYVQGEGGRDVKIATPSTVEVKEL
jgi:hypothetical protein